MIIRSLKRRCVLAGIDCLLCRQLQHQLDLFAQPCTRHLMPAWLDLVSCIKLLQDKPCCIYLGFTGSGLNPEPYYLQLVVYQRQVSFGRTCHSTASTRSC